MKNFSVQWPFDHCFLIFLIAGLETCRSSLHIHLLVSGSHNNTEHSSRDNPCSHGR